MYMELNDGRIFYSIDGAGQSIILIHGNFNDHQIWNEQIEALSSCFQVIRYDQRGYGQSSTPAAPFSNVNDLKAFIDFLKLDNVILLGSSSGGGVAVDFTLKHPQLVRKLLLVSPSISGNRFPLSLLWQAMKNYTNMRRKGSEKAIEAFLSNPFWEYYFPSKHNIQAREFVIRNVSNPNNFCRYSPALSKVDKPYALTQLSDIKAPTLVVIADGDHSYNRKTAEMLHANIQHSSKIIMHNCRHLPFVEDPQQFNQDILYFLSSTSS